MLGLGFSRFRKGLELINTVRAWERIDPMINLMLNTWEQNSWVYLAPQSLFPNVITNGIDQLVSSESMVDILELLGCIIT